MERFNSFKELKENDQLKSDQKNEVKLLDEEVIAFIELLKKSEVVKKSEEEM